MAGVNKYNEKGDEYKVINMFVREDFDYVKLKNDIAILEIAEGFKFNDLVKPIKLPSQNTAVGTDVILTGWGKMVS